MNRMIIMVDFDATLVDSDYPTIIRLKPHAQEVMKKWHEQGIYLIINTCRNGKAEWEAETFLFDNKVPFHKINDHAPFVKDKYFDPHHPISRKIYANLQIDDTSLNYMNGDKMDWWQIDEQVQNIILKGSWNVKSKF